MTKLILILCLLLTGCGGHYDAKVSGDVDVHHKIETADLHRYFEAECEEENPSYTPSEVQTCADAKLGKALSFMFGAK